MYKDSNSSYGEMSLLNHWVFAIFVFIMLVMGLVASNLPYEGAEDLIIRWHSSLGLILIPLVAWRVGWRIYQKFPHDSEASKYEMLLRRSVQTLLLAAVSLQVVTGPLYIWTEAEPLPFFGLFSIPSPFSQEAHNLHEFVEFIHKKVANPVFLILIGIHFAGALKSLFIDKRDTFRNRT